jgi:hypothetical protein
MRAALIALSLSLAAPAAAGVPLALAERQVVTLEFDRAVARLAVTDPDLLSLQTTGARVRVAALRAGRAALEVAFADGVTLVYDVAVEAARRPAAAAPAGPAQLELALGEERRVRAPGVARVLLEENGVARVSVDGETLVVIGVSTGATSLVVVDGAGARTPWSIRVR